MRNFESEVKEYVLDRAETGEMVTFHDGSWHEGLVTKVTDDGFEIVPGETHLYANVTDWD